MEELFIKQIAEYGMVAIFPTYIAYLLWKELEKSRKENSILQEKLLDTLRGQISSTQEIKAVLSQVVDTNKELIALNIYVAKTKEVTEDDK